jgi:hypothetical protein
MDSWPRWMIYQRTRRFDVLRLGDRRWLWLLRLLGFGGIVIAAGVVGFVALWAPPDMKMLTWALIVTLTPSLCLGHERRIRARAMKRRLDEAVGRVEVGGRVARYAGLLPPRGRTDGYRLRGTQTRLLCHRGRAMRVPPLPRRRGRGDGRVAIRRMTFDEWELEFACVEAWEMALIVGETDTAFVGTPFLEVWDPDSQLPAASGRAEVHEGAQVEVWGYGRTERTEKVVEAYTRFADVGRGDDAENGTAAGKAVGGERCDWEAFKAVAPPQLLVFEGTQDAPVILVPLADRPRAPLVALAAVPRHEPPDQE